MSGTTVGARRTHPAAAGGRARAACLAPPARGPLRGCAAAVVRAITTQRAYRRHHLTIAATGHRYFIHFSTLQLKVFNIFKITEFKLNISKDICIVTG